MSRPSGSVGDYAVRRARDGTIHVVGLGPCADAPAGSTPDAAGPPGGGAPGWCPACADNLDRALSLRLSALRHASRADAPRAADDGPPSEGAPTPGPPTRPEDATFTLRGVAFSLGLHDRNGIAWTLAVVAADLDA